MTAAQGEAGELAHQLVIDYLVKGAILAAALMILLVGMALMWKKAGRKGRGHDR
ncbi:hypothetical protein [Streptomyces sp. G-G2]|uniref:hypothetical protein n=1 Tax=Streptomyces sp. G-G2 TaxID=3046201 RepID=UPI0024B893DB|nr:hypothetical protein [Streptomyces sp. G-G2]MDJ0380320.1 hypothetical protein [Streptomyces sp. G-G2]